MSMLSRTRMNMRDHSCMFELPPVSLHVQQDGGWQTAVPADSIAMQSETPQMSVADPPEDVTAVGSDDITALAEQLATAVGVVGVAAGGGSQPGAPADGATEGLAAGSAVAAEERRPAALEAPSDAVYSDGSGASHTNGDGAADAE